MSVTNAQQWEVFQQAQEIFRARNHVRGDLWADHDALAHLRMAHEKLHRIEHNLQGDGGPIDTDVLIDDALDCINFTAFLIRKVTGKVPGKETDETVRSV